MESSKAILYVHGKGGCAEEAQRYRAVCACDVFGADFQELSPWTTPKIIRADFEKLRAKYESVAVIANSIGAWFSMLALHERSCDVARAFFISPVLDMQRLILDLMSAANVTEAELRAMGEIDTSFGEKLSWDYLSFVRDTPIDWNVRTEILYAGCDTLIPRETVDAFVSTHDARLMVMENGEHWFHTDEQLAFLDSWLRGCMI